MSGTRFLLDTNIVIGLLKGEPIVLKHLQQHRVSLQQSDYSFMTRIELLGYSGITDLETEKITAILGVMRYLPMTLTIEDKVIEIRRQQGLKIPDAIIAATAHIHGLTLITLDQRLERSWVDLE